MRLSLKREELEYLEEVLDQLCWDQDNATESSPAPHTFELEKLEPLLNKIRKEIE